LRPFFNTKLWHLEPLQQTLLSDITKSKTKKMTDNEESCKECSRSTAMIAKQESDLDLLPYLKCKSCKAAMYYERDTDYVEDDDGDIGGIPLISHCFSCSWKAALQRVRIYPKEADSLPAGDCKAESALHWACYNSAPVEVIREIAAAAPKMVEFQAGWHSQGLPLDCLLSTSRYYFFKPDLTSKVVALLEANMNAAALSVQAAWYNHRRALVNDALVAGCRYQDKVPQQDCRFLEDTSGATNNKNESILRHPPPWSTSSQLRR
jgi:hypothetical protein